MLGFFLKTLFFVVLAVIVRGTLPRYRIDQLVSKYWKYWVFIYIFFIVEACVIMWGLDSFTEAYAHYLYTLED